MTPYYDDGKGIVIFLGDCRDILPSLPDCSVDMIFTDPPYGHNNNNGDLIHNREAALGRLPSGSASPVARPISNDGADDVAVLIPWFFHESARLLRHGSCCCCGGGGGGPDPQFARWSLWMDEALDFKQMVVWDKGPMGMGWHYRRSYETVLVAQKDASVKCKWYDETNKIENIIRHIPKIIPQATDHPTPKPPELCSWFIQLHTQGDDLVLDPFMGGGSTAYAAKALGRKFIGVEIEEAYCEATAKRLAQEVLSL